MWQWIQGNLGIIIIALSFGVSGLGWLLQQLKQAQEKKKADQLRQRARLESLRTGRSEAPVEAQAQQRPQAAAGETPRQRLEDLAKRRQQEQRQRSADQRTQLEEQLRRRREAIDAQRQRQQEQRRRQLEARRGGQQPQSGTRQPQRQQQQTQRSSSRQRPAQRPTAQPAQRPGDRRRSSPPPAPQRQARPTQEEVVPTVVESRRPRPSAPVQAPTTTRGRPGIATALGSGFDLRQAVIMREILDKPIGLRGPADQGH